MLSGIAAWTPPTRPAFLFVFLANWLTNMEMAENIVKVLGSPYVAVRPDQLADLFKQFRSV
jgi:hypothetical protein